MERKPQGPIAMAGETKSGGSSIPVGKILLGCGCLTVAVLGIISVAMVMMVYAAGEKAKEELGEDFSFTQALEVAMKGVDGAKPSATEASGADGTGAAKGTDGKSDSAVKPSKEKTELSPERVREHLKKPLTQKDVDLVFGIYEDLQETDAYGTWHDSIDSMKKIGKKGDQGTLERMKMMRDGMKGFDAYQDLFQEYDRLVKEAGGYNAYLGSLIRISGGAAAAKQIAKDHKKKEPASDEVAALILEDRSGIKKELDKTTAEAKKMMKKNEGKPQQGNSAMLMMLQQPGTIAIGRMPEKSFDNWKSFSVEQRKRIIDLPKQSAKDFPGMLIGVTWSGEPLIVSSELQALSGK